MSRALRFLVAEDNLINQKLTVHTLRQLGHQGTVVGDGEQVLRCLRSQPFDVVLLDVMMPVLDGWQTLAKLRSSMFPRVREAIVIMASAMDEQGDIAHYLQAGADGFVPKPIVARSLAEELDRLGLR